MRTPAQIALFLAQMKSILETSEIILVERAASLAFLGQRGMTGAELKERFLELCVSDCFDGPEPDRDDRYEDFTVAEFSPYWNGERVYLKVSICSQRIVCKCLSVKEYQEKGNRSYE